MHPLSSSMAAAAAALLLGGCASFSSDGGFDAVREMTHARTGQSPAYQRSAEDTAAVAARVTELLAQPLAPDSAVEIALLNNRGLQADFGALGIAEAERVRAGRLRNPGFSFGRLSGGGITEIDRALMFDVLGLLTLPANRALGQGRFEQAQLQATVDAVRIAADTRRAFFNAVAAAELARYADQVESAADAAGELARRMRDAGNFSALAQMREQAFHADAVALRLRTHQQALVERERLTRLLGLSGAQIGFALPEQLPALPDAPLAPENAEQTAMAMRLDVAMARRDAEATAAALGLTRATRVVNVLNVGAQSKRETAAPALNGVEIELELPLFDFGSTRNARAEALYMQALHRTAEVAVNAQSEVRETYAAYRAAYALAKHYRDEVVPLRRAISDENLLRYNGMLISVFDLLADAREQIASVTASVDALREHWLAQTQLEAALSIRLPTTHADNTTPKAQP